MKEAQVLHLLQLQSIELLRVGNKQTQQRDNNYSFRDYSSTIKTGIKN